MSKIGFILFLFFVFHLKEAFARPHSLAGDAKDHFCYIEDGLVRCNGVENSASAIILFPDELTNVKLLAIGSGHSCAITHHNKIKCWVSDVFGSPSFIKKAKELTLHSPTEIVLGNSIGYILDSGKLIKWSALKVFSSAYPKVHSLTGNTSHACFLREEKAECIGPDFYGETIIPDSVVLPIKKISAGNSKTCLIDSEGLKCWGLCNNSAPCTVPIFHNNEEVLDVRTNWGTTCAVYKYRGLTCWGGGGVLYKAFEKPIFPEEFLVLIDRVVIILNGEVVVLPPLEY